MKRHGINGLTVWKHTEAMIDLVGGEVTDGAVGLRRFQLLQAPFQVFQRLHGQLLSLLVYKCRRIFSVRPY